MDVVGHTTDAVDGAPDVLAGLEDVFVHQSLVGFADGHAAILGAKDDVI